MSLQCWLHDYRAMAILRDKIWNGKKNHLRKIKFLIEFEAHKHGQRIRSVSLKCKLFSMLHYRYIHIQLSRPLVWNKWIYIFWSWHFILFCSAVSVQVQMQLYQSVTARETRLWVGGLCTGTHSSQSALSICVFVQIRTYTDFPKYTEYLCVSADQDIHRLPVTHWVFVC